MAAALNMLLRLRADRLRLQPHLRQLRLELADERLALRRGAVEVGDLLLLLAVGRDELLELHVVAAGARLVLPRQIAHLRGTRNST